MFQYSKYNRIFIGFCFLCIKKSSNVLIHCRDGSSPKLKGKEAICRVGAKNIVKSKRAEGTQKFLGL